LVREQGVALVEVARRLGVSTSGISKIIKRANLPTYFIIALERACLPAVSFPGLNEYPHMLVIS
jgi:hypothetical protein